MSSVPIPRKEEPKGVKPLGKINRFALDSRMGADAPAPMSWWKQQEILEKNRKAELQLLKIIKRERDPYTQTITPHGYGQKWFSERACCVYFRSPSKDDPVKLTKDRLAVLNATAKLEREAK